MSEMETRVTILERDVAELRQLVPVIHGMDKKLDLLAARKECPSPGLCLSMEPRVRALEDARTKLAGALAVVAALGGLAGAALSGVISYLKGH